MADTSGTAQAHPGGGRFELRREPGAEGIFYLVAVAPTELKLSLKRHRADKDRIAFTLEGTQKNLPADTVCSVLLKTHADGMPAREYTLVNVPLRVQGTSCSLEFEADIYEAGFFGEGHAELTVVPDFPFAQACYLEKPFEFDIPLGLRGLDLRAPVLFGRRFHLKPDMDARFTSATLRLSIYHSVEARRGEAPGMAPEARRYATLEWSPDDRDAKEWRVGCAWSGDGLRLPWRAPSEGEYAFDLRLEVLRDIEGETKPYVLWERPRACVCPKPRLTGFEFKHHAVTATVEHLDPDFELPLELAHWRYEAQARGDALSFTSMDPVSRPVVVNANEKGLFLRQFLDAEDWLKRKSFALLRIPRSLTGTDEYVPIRAVLDFDETQFLAFEDEDLWLEAPSSSKTPARQKLDRVRQELVTALASKELTVRPSRMPRFGDVWLGARDNHLLITVKVIGDLDYWREASPVFSVCDAPPPGEPTASRETEVLRLEARPLEGNPRYYEALVRFDDPRIRQKVSIQGRVSKPDARLWNELVAAPPAFSVEYPGVPQLQGLRAEFVQLTDDTSILEVRCQALHIPNGKDGEVIEFRLYEFFADVAEPVVFGAVPFRYEVAKGAAGQCDARGRVVARLREPAIVERMRSNGRFRIEARLVERANANHSSVLPVVHLDLKGTPRRIEGTVIYGSHPNVTEAFRRKVLLIAEQLEMNADDLMACMAFETGNAFRADTPNRAGHPAFGLIQFTAINEGKDALDIKLSALVRMSAVEQLDYVAKYFRMWKARSKLPLDNLGDVYACILCPAALGKDASFVCYAKGARGYEPNKGLDRGDKGFITKADILVPVERHLHEGQKFRK
ncbi:hypothetical protein [Corallococcus macrosporus]|uniref:Transglycosylase SLT domain-containing protein n=1 Tax=Myxococcus fulvus (strain ATCC BAA-855 / HW-1) TaxID=483219 RepID=F8CHL0_MYXFH|nr:hypothetical protein [Corallococcus macrosporus]AEI67511.1 hypothetical protein LILAB_28120 [Corallococcus macrosporus]